MNIKRWFNEYVYIQNKIGTDIQGLPEYGEELSFRAKVEEEQGITVGKDGKEIVTRAKMFIPIGITIGMEDRVTYYNKAFTVVDTIIEKNHRGKPIYMEVQLK